MNMHKARKPAPIERVCDVDVIEEARAVTGIQDQRVQSGSVSLDRVRWSSADIGFVDVVWRKL